MKSVIYFIVFLFSTQTFARNCFYSDHRMVIDASNTSYEVESLEDLEYASSFDMGLSYHYAKCNMYAERKSEIELDIQLLKIEEPLSKSLVLPSIRYFYDLLNNSRFSLSPVVSYQLRPFISTEINEHHSIGLGLRPTFYFQETAMFHNGVSLLAMSFFDFDNDGDVGIIIEGKGFYSFEFAGKREYQFAIVARASSQDYDIYDNQERSLRFQFGYLF